MSDISNLVISGMCAESYPCQHKVTYTQNGEKVECTMSGQHILSLLRSRNFDENSWEMQHFSGYSSMLEESA